MVYKRAKTVLRSGGVIVFPTDTVMGIGCLMDNAEAIQHLYKVKKRSIDQPTAVLVSSLGMAVKIMKNQPDKYLQKLLNKFWPGGLSIVMEASEVVPQSIMGKTKEIGIRIPRFQPLTELISDIGIPLVATSANFKGERTPVGWKDIDPELLKLVDFVIEEDSTGEEGSTFIKYLRNGKYELVRDGAVKVSL